VSSKSQKRQLCWENYDYDSGYDIDTFSEPSALAMPAMPTPPAIETQTSKAMPLPATIDVNDDANDTMDEHPHHYDCYPELLRR
jgi:hypothetical protein